ncbi:histidine triad nucleotide-binding protein [Patescibacteria group bacterium]
MCIFCQIVNHEQSADIVYEDKEFIVIKDINPKAKIHLLIVPKDHIESVNELEDSHRDLIAKMILMAKEMAKQSNINKTGYKLVFNVGRGGGQIVDHIHLHLLGGGERK